MTASPAERRAGRRYLLTSAVGAASVANAWRPFARNGYPVIGTFLAGIGATELPLLTAAQHAATAGWFARKGALRSPAGRIGLGLTTASLATLIQLYRSACRDEDVLDAALVDCLGSGYRERAHRLEIEALPAARLRHPFPRSGRRSPLLAHRDLAYGPAGVRNHLDVWRRTDLPAGHRAPVVLHIHGGAWVGGSKAMQGVPLLSHFARNGWVTASMNYRLSPRATWPDHIVDVKRAVTWLREYAADNGGDPGFIAVTGGSAGGHLSAVAALSNGYEGFQPGFETANATVQAAVPLYGAYDITDHEGTGRNDAVGFWERHVMKQRFEQGADAWTMASPVLMARPDAPPMFVIHGTNDALVRVEGARLFVQRLRDAGAPTVCYAELPHARHSFDVFHTRRTWATVAAIERFLLVAYAQHLENAPAAADRHDNDLANVGGLSGS